MKPTNHAKNRMRQRGISERHVNELMENGQKTDYKDKQKYTDPKRSNIVVIANGDKVITAYRDKEMKRKKEKYKRENGKKV